MHSEIISRDEFQQRRTDSATAMANDHVLLDKALQVKVQAGHDYLWVHQPNWMGEPCLQLPTDMIALSECVFRSRPDYIIECGVAWGGTTLYLASLLALSGGKSVIGVDTFLPDDLRTRLSSHPGVSERIHLVEGSSTDPAVVASVRSMVEPGSKVMVLLDSDHTHDHVLAELRAYAPFVKPGQYLVCGDTAIDRQPPAPLRPRAWGAGNNPATALRVFLSEKDGSNFEADLSIENKLLISNNWGGYLRRR